MYILIKKKREFYRIISFSLFIIFLLSFSNTQLKINGTIRDGQQTNRNITETSSPESRLPGQEDIIQGLTPQASVVASWTFMVYLDADNNLEEAGIKDINEMEEVGSSNDVNIVVQIDRATGYDTSNGDWTGTRRYYVKQDTSVATIGSTLEQDLGELNMGSSTTLSDFITWAQTNYPAEHYALVLWDHGSGVLSGPNLGGVAFDEASGNDYLTEQEILDAISGKGIDLVGFDACLMASTEFWYALKGEVSVLVGSEKTEPGDGWPYDTILTDLVSNPLSTPSDLARYIVNEYDAFYEQNYPTLSTTQSAVYGQELDTVASALDNLTAALINDIANYKTALQNIRDDIVEYDGLPYVDLYDLVSRIQIDIPAVDDEAQAVLTAIDNAVILREYSGNVVWSHGLTIYFPATVDAFSNQYRDTTFALSTNWDEFLLTYFDAPTDDDQFEDNDDFLTAALVLPRLYTNLVWKDDDYYKIDMVFNQSIAVTMQYTYVSGSCDLELYLYGENGTLLSYSETTSDTETVSWVCDANQSVFIVVINAETGAGYTYSLNIYIPIQDDDFEENDNFAEAVDISTLANQTIDNLVAIDEDYYSINVASGDALVSVDLYFVAANGILTLEIYHSKDGTIEKLASIGTPDDNASYMFGASDEFNTLYYIVVINYENNTDYSLRVVIDYGADDRYDNPTGYENDYINYATPIVAGEYMDLVCFDDDFYEISLTEGEWLNATIYFDNEKGDLDLYLYYNNSGDYQLMDSSWYWVDNEMITYYVRATGVYYLLVHPYEINLNYNLSVRTDQTFRLDQFDGKNEYLYQNATFPELTIDQTINNLSAWDVDFFTLNITTLDDYIVMVQYNETLGTLVLIVYNETGSQIDYSFVTAPNTIGYQFSPSITGVYYIEILPLQRFDNYSITLFRAPTEFSLEASNDNPLTVSAQFLTDLNLSYIDHIEWQWGDGETTESESVSTEHLYNTPGIYEITATIITVYGEVYSPSSISLMVYGIPENFTIWLEGDSPVTSYTFTVSWDPILDADEIIVYGTSEPFNSTENLTAIYTDTTGEISSIEITVDDNGVYYIAVVYRNPFGEAMSNLLEVEVMVEDTDSTTTSSGIDGYSQFLTLSILSLGAILYIVQKQRKRAIN